MGDKYLSILPGYQFGLASKYQKWKYLKEMKKVMSIDIEGREKGQGQ